MLSKVGIGILATFLCADREWDATKIEMERWLAERRRLNIGRAKYR